ncbi:UNVERIFIED_CONTAM: putative pectinesterase/pectinesterase inhibitor 28 [Sesamum radiatum]|uniref:Pectinesterase n=1 Tax=Sesamum radiatum TaxID=300843 RepID=A0AAW2QIU6_SESRA
MAAKAAVAGLAAILVVAMVVAVAIGVTRKESESSSISAGSTKAVQSICAPTDYKDTCEQSLSHSNATDPKELIKAAFEFTEKNIGDVIKNSPLFKEAAQDDDTKQALAICQEVLDTAIDDLKRSFDTVGEFDASKANEYLEDLKTWLSAVITNHETCIDAFENTTGGSVASGRKLLSEEEADLFISNKERSLMGLQPNAVVAQDGSGQFKTISAAIASVPQKNNQTFVIHVKAGVYKEYVEIPKKVNKIVLIGDGPLKTRISGRKNYAEGVKTFHTATVGDTGEKMKNLLKTAREMSSNGLAMVSNMSSIISSLQLGNPASRKLLLSEKVGYGGDPTDYAPGEEPHFNLDSKRRQLLSATSFKPNAVVAQDGSGQFNTIRAAIASVPPKNNQLFVIHVKAGVYKEQVQIPKKMNKIVLIGDGPLKTRISGRLNFAEGVKTYHTATVAVNADDFMAKDIGFENTAGALGHQAVALRVSGDRAVFYNVHIDGYQDTLYSHTYRQYYRDCSISGTIDFIFGDAVALFQNCKFVVRKPGPNQACMITAQGRIDRHSLGVISIQNGDIVAEPALLQASPPHKVYLGRPWKQLSRTIIMQSNIGGFIAPEGWSPWAGNFALDTLYYAEYQNRGPGSDLKARVTWKGIQKLSPQMAESWTGGKLFGGDEWVKNSGVPYVPTMMQV